MIEIGPDGSPIVVKDNDTTSGFVVPSTTPLPKIEPAKTEPDPGNVKVLINEAIKKNAEVIGNKKILPISKREEAAKIMAVAVDENRESKLLQIRNVLKDSGCDSMSQIQGLNRIKEILGWN